MWWLPSPALPGAGSDGRRSSSPPSQPGWAPVVAMLPPVDRLSGALLYFVCDRPPGRRPLADVLAAALRGGVDVFQLRDKTAGDAEILEAAVQARELCHAAGALFVL